MNKPKQVADDLYQVELVALVEAENEEAIHFDLKLDNNPPFRHIGKYPRLGLYVHRVTGLRFLLVSDNSPYGYCQLSGESGWHRTVDYATFEAEFERVGEEN